MGQIKALPPEVVAKIAAGEVVERPASVVKELLENSLDAGSASVKVEVLGAGRKLIRVTDDGEGMTGEEALQALQSHTTSKIESLEDLFSLRTFGFRGEALASVAAVSRLKITTRKEGQLSGNEVRVEGGMLSDAGETGCPSGTSVEVRDLFFNVPARLKFLKSPGTELGHISEILAKTALANPQTRFQLFHEGKLLANYPLRQDPSARLVEALGKEVDGKIFPFRLQQGELRVEGFAGEPDLNRPNGRGIYLFVNRRPVRDRLLTHAILEGYRNVIPKDRYPIAVLLVEVPPSDLDVNVHPGKWEVKFANSETVHRLVIHAIRGMIEETPWLKIKGVSQFEESRERPAAYLPQGRGISIPLSWPISLRVDPREESQEAGRGLDSGVAFLGQVQGTYLIFVSPEGLLLLDQHAAHERVLLEKLSNDLFHGGIPKQPLLLPEVIELSSNESKIIEEHLGDLARMGFDLEPAGLRTFWVKSVPQILADQDPLETLREAVKEISSWGKEAGLKNSYDSLLKMMACHGAIQAHRPMGGDEARALWADLQNCRFPSHCPHGRPTQLKITHLDLEKMFGRR
jgi:DNA mismatch repair protein MutL